MNGKYGEREAPAMYNCGVMWWVVGNVPLLSWALTKDMFMRSWLQCKREKRAECGAGGQTRGRISEDGGRSEVKDKNLWAGKRQESQIFALTCIFSLCSNAVQDEPF